MSTMIVATRNLSLFYLEKWKYEWFLKENILCWNIIVTAAYFEVIKTILC